MTSVNYGERIPNNVDLAGDRRAIDELDFGAGAAEVDAKMNSILAAELSAVAESRGHDADLIPAMMIMDAELWASKVASGEFELVDADPHGRSDREGAEELDSRRTVLTLTASQAERFGIGRIVRGGHDAMGELMRVDGWTVASNLGERAMVRATKQRQREIADRRQDMEDAIELEAQMKHMNEVTLEQAISLANSLEPRRLGPYTIDSRSGCFTAQSRQDWMQNHDRAIRAWRNVLSVLKRLDTMDKRFRRLTGHSYFERSTGRLVARQVEEIISRLHRDRNKPKP